MGRWETFFTWGQKNSLILLGLCKIQAIRCLWRCAESLEFLPLLFSNLHHCYATHLGYLQLFTTDWSPVDEFAFLLFFCGVALIMSTHREKSQMSVTFLPRVKDAVVTVGCQHPSAHYTNSLTNCVNSGYFRFLQVMWLFTVIKLSVRVNTPTLWKIRPWMYQHD